MRTLIFSIFVLLMGCASQKEAFESSESAKSEREPYVLLISYDGFKHDYVEKFDAPNFKRFLGDGIAAEALIPSFPSKTFPNHYTIVTGMYPGNHNLVDNSFYNTELSDAYSIKDRSKVENPDFYGGLPLWQLVQRNGMKSAAYFWVGSETKVAGSYPDYWKKYNMSTPNEARIEAVLDWLKLPSSERPRFISLYFSIVDTQGHRTGPDADQTKEAVLEADRLLGLVMDGLHGIDLDVNVVVTSDHGMHKVKPDHEHLVLESQFVANLDKSKAQYFNSGTHMQIYCHDESYCNELRTKLAKLEGPFKVYSKNQMPDEWHFKESASAGDIYIAMDPGYMVMASGKRTLALKADHDIGTHGYDPAITKEVNGIFYAKGPQIDKNKQIPAFQNIHIYPFVASILGIKDLPNIDGKKEVLEPYIIH